MSIMWFPEPASSEAILVKAGYLTRTTLNANAWEEETMLVPIVKLNSLNTKELTIKVEVQEAE